MTTHALGAYDAWLTCRQIKHDSLMTSILTGYLTTTATYATLTVYLGEYHRITIQLTWCHKVVEQLTDEV